MHKKGIDSLLNNANHQVHGSNLKSKMIYTSPAKRPNSKTVLPAKLEEYVKSASKMGSPPARINHEDSKKTHGPVCRECVLLLKMQSNLSQELAEKEMRLSKCLRIVDELLQ